MKKAFALSVVIILAIVLGACAPAAKAPMPAAMAAPSNSAAPQSGAAPAPPTFDKAAPMAESGAVPSSPGQPAPVERIVIKNGSLSIVVDDPAKAMDFVTKLAESKGGYIVSSNLYKTKTENGLEIPQATISIRIPADQLTDTMDKIKSLVKDVNKDIQNEKVSGQDVTQEYTDTKSRLKNLENTRDQLREIMASAQKTEDVLAVLTQLNQITEQIEVLQGQINYFDTSAKFSEVGVEILSQEAVKPLTVGGWQPVGVARDAIQALINMLKFLVNLSIWIILFLLPLFIIIFIPLRILWVIIRRWQKKRKASKVVAAEKNVSPEPPSEQK